MKTSSATGSVWSYLAVIWICFANSNAQQIVFGSDGPRNTPPPTRSLDKPCLTAEGQQGLCQTVFDCPSLLVHVRNRNLALLRKLQCPNTNKRQILLCCTDNVKLTPPANNISEPGCGETHKEPTRIVGGVPVEAVGDLPWMTALEYNGDPKFKCGGAVINKRWILTAAHCITLEGPVSARVGDLNLNTSTDDSFQNPPQNINIEATFKHPDFHRRFRKPKGLIHDIALLKTTTDIKFSFAAKPICMPEKPQVGPRQSEETLIAGWGLTEFGGISTIHMQYARINITDIDQCRKNYKQVSVGIEPDAHICASGNSSRTKPGCTPDSEDITCQGGVDSCEGDSGGPLMSFEKMDRGIIKFHAIGIVSFAVGCGNPVFPGIYTRVESYLDWIQKTMAQH